MVTICKNNVNYSAVCITAEQFLHMRRSMLLENPMKQFVFIGSHIYQILNTL